MSETAKETSWPEKWPEVAKALLEQFKVPHLVFNPREGDLDPYSGERIYNIAGDSGYFYGVLYLSTTDSPESMVHEIAHYLVAEDRKSINYGLDDNGKKRRKVTIEEEEIECCKLQFFFLRKSLGWKPPQILEIMEDYNFVQYHGAPIKEATKEHNKLVKEGKEIYKKLVNNAY